MKPMTWLAMSGFAWAGLASAAGQSVVIAQCDFQSQFKKESERCEAVAGYITPRVGGVGPTTIAMLFRNAVECAERRAGITPGAAS